MALAHVIRLQIIKAAKNSPAIAIMIDESTDVSHTGQMVIYIRLRTTSGLCGGTRVSRGESARAVFDFRRSSTCPGRRLRPGIKY